MIILLLFSDILGSWIRVGKILPLLPKNCSTAFLTVYGGMLIENDQLKKILTYGYSAKKNCFDYRVHGIQINYLVLTVSTKNLVSKNMYRVPRYYQKNVENLPSKPNQQNLTHFC